MTQVQVLDRTFDILERLAAAGRDLGVSELHADLGLPLGTIHRLLENLVRRGYAAQDATTRRYGPGPKLLEIGALALVSARFDLHRIAHQQLEALTVATGETSNLVVPQGNDGVYIDQVASPHLVRMFTEIGRRAPLYCTGAGKAILSGLSQAFVDEYLSRVTLEPWTPQTRTTAGQLRADIVTARERGYALDNEERELGVRCVAAPIFDVTGRCLGAISISGPTTRVTPGAIERIGPEVRRAAEACSEQLGYR
ncbi:MAG TPA: IclR family transcriptional regulator [Nitrolancea sp.]